MRNRLIENKRRLAKKQVSELIQKEGKFHKEYTKRLETRHATGFVTRDLIYELNNDLFLLVHDPEGHGIAGKGDIYKLENLLRLIEFKEKAEEDYKNNRASSVDNWHYFSRHKENLINHIEGLVKELAGELHIESAILNFSYESLDKISKGVNQYGISNAENQLYDNLVAYIGEVLIRRVNGKWNLYYPTYGNIYPFVDVGIKHLQYMPVNVVFENFLRVYPVDLRKSTANEVRRHTLARKLNSK